MEILKKLIQINSVTGGEEEIQKHILNLLSLHGLKPIVIKGNVLVHIKGLASQNALIFNAHIDTVETGDYKLWNRDPFSGFQEGNKIYGLGASDNKASIASLLLLAAHLSKNKPDCDIFLTFTVGEEVDGHGANDVVKWLSSKYLKKYQNIAGIICEPTGLAEIATAHKGNMFLKVTTYGKSGHGSVPIPNSSNSIFKMYSLINSLGVLGGQWQKKYKNKVLGSPSIGLTSITAGSVASPNKFPDSCFATFDVRTVPEMHNLAYKEINKIVKKMGELKFLYPAVTYGYTDGSLEIVGIFEEVTKMPVVSFPGSTDMCFFTEAKIPSVIFGPGEKNMMHKPNEYCYSDKVAKCASIFQKVIYKFARMKLSESQNF